MKAEFFKAVCPLEIGDTVAIRLAEKGGETREAYYLRKAAWQSHREQSHCTRSQILQHFTI
jgi:hypothetical protein